MIYRAGDTVSEIGLVESGMDGSVQVAGVFTALVTVTSGVCMLSPFSQVSVITQLFPDSSPFGTL